MQCEKSRSIAVRLAHIGRVAYPAARPGLKKIVQNVALMVERKLMTFVDKNETSNCLATFVSLLALGSGKTPDPSRLGTCVEATHMGYMVPHAASRCQQGGSLPQAVR